MPKEIVETTFDKDRTIYQMGFLFIHIHAHAHTQMIRHTYLHTLHGFAYAVNVYLVWPFKKITYCSCQLSRTKMTGLSSISIYE